MSDFKVIRHDGKEHFCKNCGNTTYNKYYVKSFNPELIKKTQILMCLIRCNECETINMVYHSKIYKIILLNDNELEVN